MYTEPSERQDRQYSLTAALYDGPDGSPVRPSAPGEGPDLLSPGAALQGERQLGSRAHLDGPKIDSSMKVSMRRVPARLQELANERQLAENLPTHAGREPGGR